jgi:hypothetical protein
MLQVRRFVQCRINIVPEHSEPDPEGAIHTTGDGSADNPPCILILVSPVSKRPEALTFDIP